MLVTKHHNKPVPFGFTPQRPVKYVVSLKAACAALSKRFTYKAFIFTAKHLKARQPRL